jgi:nucleotide-binding universal stress UspA family protein
MFKTVIVGVCDGARDADAIALADLLAEPGATVLETTIHEGRSVANGLHDAAVQHGADLIVIGSSRRGLLGRVLAGDDVTATLRAAPCTVAVAPQGFASEPHTVAQIGVGYDGTPHAQAAMDMAKAIAAHNGIRVQALGVATPPQGLISPIGISAVQALEAKRRETERCIAELAPGIVARAVDGVADHRLAELSTEVDLLLVGSSRRGAIGRVLLGSTSEALSREASCPLLVVTAPEPSRPSRERPDRPASAPVARFPTTS